MAAIAAALKAEFGGSPAAIKSIGRVTHRNERAVRNWFEGKNSPSAENLVQLIQHSDSVLETVLRLADRRELSAATLSVGRVGCSAGLRRVEIGLRHYARKASPLALAS